MQRPACASETPAARRSQSFENVWKLQPQTGMKMRLQMVGFRRQTPIMSNRPHWPAGNSQ
jgi:hypothetical protein